MNLWMILAWPNRYLFTEYRSSASIMWNTQEWCPKIQFNNDNLEPGFRLPAPPSHHVDKAASCELGADKGCDLIQGALPHTLQAWILILSHNQFSLYKFTLQLHTGWVKKKWDLKKYVYCILMTSFEDWTDLNQKLSFYSTARFGISIFSIWYVAIWLGCADLSLP